jgi:hypothetical protein
MYDDVMNELKSIKEEEQRRLENDVYMRTIVKLLTIEKKALYGSFPQKNKSIDKEITSELKAYRDQLDAAK